MTFVDPAFLGLFAATWCAYWLLGRRAQNLLLVGVGAVFYGWVHPWFLAPLVGSTLLDYVVARRIVAEPDRARAWVTLSVAANLGVLLFFKAQDFFVPALVPVWTAAGLDPGTLPFLLPAGISFYTFQTMSYTLDVHRGKERPRSDLLDVAVFVSFFPQLVAGPIERAADLLPQVERPRVWSWDDQRAGLTLALWGAFKKVAIADNLAPWVDRAHAHADPSFWMIWAAQLAFSVQLLCDFSGYTDLARGTARMLGFRLSENFRWPYMATTPMAAWSRFHMTLTRWLTDYVYYPLAQAPWVRQLKLPGTTVGGAGLVARVTIITFVLSGLWHGVGWHFVLWGAYLAGMQILYLWAQRRLPRAWLADARWQVLTIPLMFGVQLVAQLLFRSPTVERIVHHLTRSPFADTDAQRIVAAGTAGVALGFAALLVAVMIAEQRLLPRWRERPWFPLVQAAAWGATLTGIAVLGRPSSGDFIYFQF